MGEEKLHYVYTYETVDGVVVYVGVGKGNRSEKEHKENGELWTAVLEARKCGYPLSRVTRHGGLTKEESHEVEVKLILRYGRRDLGTGTLYNKTSGGKGCRGLQDTTRQEMSERLKQEHKNGWSSKVCYDGRTLGEHRLEGAKKGSEMSRIAVSKKMDEKYAAVVPVVKSMREEGRTLKEIVTALNSMGYQTTRKNPWGISTLRTLIQKYLGDSYLGGMNLKLNPCLAARG